MLRDYAYQLHVLLLFYAVFMKRDDDSIITDTHDAWRICDPSAIIIYYCTYTYYI